MQRASLVAQDVIALELVDPTGSQLPAWEPGAHIDLVLPSGTVRQYSLCGPLDDRSRYRVAVLRESESRGGSQEVHDTGLVGKRLSIVGPRNTFALIPADRYLFLAGGIGITPLISMIERAQHDKTPWQLVYAARSHERMAFAQGLREAHPDRCRFIAVDQQGRPDLATLISELPSQTAVYCCGPSGMIAAAQEAAAQHLDAGLIRIERFAADPHAVAAGNSVNEPFEVELARTGVTLTVPPDQSILDVVLDSVPYQLYSCEEGFCGTCRTRYLAGEPEHRDSVLTDEEREQFMMICVGRSRSAKLVLDL